jgi:hypothetical protein
MTTDRTLPVLEAYNFIDQFAKAMYLAEQDVIDAYCSAQQVANPSRLRQTAQNDLAFSKMPGS